MRCVDAQCQVGCATTILRGPGLSQRTRLRSSERLRGGPYRSVIRERYCRPMESGLALNQAEISSFPVSGVGCGARFDAAIRNFIVEKGVRCKRNQEIGRLLVHGYRTFGAGRHSWRDGVHLSTLDSLRCVSTHDDRNLVASNRWRTCFPPWICGSPQGGAGAERTRASSRCSYGRQLMDRVDGRT